MRTIIRKEAVKLLSSFEVGQLSSEKRESVLLGWWGIDEEDEEFHVLPDSLQAKILSEEEPSEPEKDCHDPLLEIALSATYRGVRNSYIEKN